MNIERKTIPCEVKAAADDGSFELYALTFGNIDRVGDIILPGAVSNVDELVKDGWGALNHSSLALPVAYPESATQDAKGLLVKGRFHTTPDAQAVRTVVRERMAAGKSVPCSIGYVVDDASFEMRGGEPVRLLKSIRVFEFSFVNLPANPAAGVVSAKSLDDGPGWLDRLKAMLGLDLKRGRVVSAANHGRLSGHAAKLEEVATDLKAFLADHDPNKDVDEAAGKSDGRVRGRGVPPPSGIVATDVDLLRLRRRALEGRRSMRCP